MDAETLKILHVILTIITTIGTVVLGYWKYIDSRIDKSNDNKSHLEDEVHELELKVAILEERVNNQTDLLDKLDNRLEDIRRAI